MAAGACRGLKKGAGTGAGAGAEIGTGAGAGVAACKSDGRGPSAAVATAANGCRGLSGSGKVMSRQSPGQACDRLALNAWVAGRQATSSTGAGGRRLL